MKRYWHNYITGEDEERAAPSSDEEAVRYIPQNPGAQNLYSLQREMGSSVSEAMLVILIAATQAVV